MISLHIFIPGQSWAYYPRSKVFPCWILEKWAAFSISQIQNSYLKWNNCHFLLICCTHSSRTIDFSHGSIVWIYDWSIMFWHMYIYISCSGYHRTIAPCSNLGDDPNDGYFGIREIYATLDSFKLTTRGLFQHRCVESTPCASWLRDWRPPGLVWKDESYAVMWRADTQRDVQASLAEDMLAEKEFKLGKQR